MCAFFTLLSRRLHATVFVENKKKRACVSVSAHGVGGIVYRCTESCVFCTWAGAGVCGDLTGGEYCLGARLLNIQGVGLTLSARLKEKKSLFSFCFSSLCVCVWVCVHVCVCKNIVRVQKLCAV